MGFFDYVKAVRKFRDQEDVLETIRRMKQFDGFHLLRNSSLRTGARAGEMLPRANSQYIAWMTVCGGGYLFDTTLLSVEEEDPDLGLSFDTLADYNTPEARRELALPEGYFVIAVRNYGDPICLSAEDDRVYLWNMEEGEFETIWDCFYDFLGDETDTAIEIIGNGDMEPVPIKFQDEEEG